MKSVLKLVVAIAFCGFFNSMMAQDGLFITKTGTIEFLSDAPAEKINAKSQTASLILNTKTGDLVFQLNNKSFQFKNNFMQEHFNEKYMESDKFPKSTFKGKITNLSTVNFSKDGKYKVNVEGELTMHGVTNKVTTTAVLEIKGGKQILATSTITVKCADYKIIIPALVKEKVAENVEIKMTLDYNPK